MKDSILFELQAHVEQSIAPLHAGSGRIRRMREELLAHLVGLFEVEFTRLHDEQAALESALRRFGDVAELQDELKASVPMRERILSRILGKKEKIMWRVFFILGFVAVLVGFGFICPALQQIRFEEVLPMTIVLLIFGIAISLGGLWSMVHGVRRFRIRGS